MAKRKSFDELEIKTPKELGKILYGEQSKSKYSIRYIRDLISAGADLEVRDGDGCTPLHTAVVRNQVDLCKELILHGANVNSKDNDGYCILYNVIEFLYYDMVKLLLAAGADIEARSEFGDTPLHQAVTLSRLMTIMFIEAGANTNAKNNDGQTPWDIAQEYIRANVPQLNPDYNG